MVKTTEIQATKTPASNKHDEFFRGACSKRFIVEPLLKHFIDSKLSQKFDYDALELSSDSYITPELANFYSDILWSTRFKEGGELLQLLLLFEHKSFIPKRIHIQLLRYMIEDWTKQIDNQLKALQTLKRKSQKNEEKIKLVLILPIVLYHGKQAWKNPKFEDLFGNLPDILKPFLPDFEFIVIDLSKYSDQEILDTQAGLLVNMLLLLRHSFDHDYLVKNVELLLTGIEDYDPDSDYWNFVQMLFVYFLKLLKSNPMEKAAVMQRVQTTRTKKDFYSMYDSIIDEGVEKGIEKGAMTKARQMVLRGKWKGLSADYLADLSELPFSEVENMLNAYDALLKLWQKKQQIGTIAHLSDQEVKYLLDLFAKK
jgi:Putative transposase, YhgA-like